MQAHKPSRDDNSASKEGDLHKQGFCLDVDVGRAEEIEVHNSIGGAPNVQLAFILHLDQTFNVGLYGP